MHTIRIKEKIGINWVTVRKTEYSDYEAAKDIFFYDVQTMVFMKGNPVSITWSEGKKVWGRYRVN